MGDTWPKQVTAFQTSDGDYHRTLAGAELRQRNIDGAKRATEMLEAGSSLHAALLDGGFILAGSYPDLEDVFATTKLIISHWQCRDEPGYSPCRIDDNGQIYVFGDAGSWSGPYGAPCSASEVAGYWARTKDAAERAARR